MAAGILSSDLNIQDNQQVFRQMAENNLRYWRRKTKDFLANPAMLDAEHGTLVRGLTFALDVNNLWEESQPLIVDLSPLMGRRGHWLVWETLLRKAMHTAGRVGDPYHEAAMSALLGLTLQQRSEIREAIKQYRTTIRLSRSAGNQFALARACTNLGYIYCEQGFWYRSEVLCRRALAIFEQLGNAYGTAHTHNHLGFLYTRQAKEDQAHHHFEQAFEIWQENDDRHSIMRGLINLGVLQNQEGQFEQAKASFLQAREIGEAVGDESHTGFILSGLTYSCQKMGDLKAAESYALEADKLFRNSPNIEPMAVVWCNLGIIYTKLRQWQDTEYYLKAALEQACKIRSVYLQLEVLIAQIRYALARGMGAEARDRLEQLRACIRQNPQYNQYEGELRQLKEEYRSLPDEKRQTAI